MTRNDISLIFDRLADHLGVPVKAIRGKKRNAALVNARRLMLYWMRDHVWQKNRGQLFGMDYMIVQTDGERDSLTEAGWCPVSYPTLARLFRKDHSSLVLMARKRGEFSALLAVFSASFDPDPPTSGVAVEGL